MFTECCESSSLHERTWEGRLFQTVLHDAYLVEYLHQWLKIEKYALKNTPRMNGGSELVPWSSLGGLPFCSFRQFLAKMYRFATIQNVTDDRRQTTQRAEGALTVGQKWKLLQIWNFLSYRTSVAQNYNTDTGRKIFIGLYIKINTILFY